MFINDSVRTRVAPHIRKLFSFTCVLIFFATETSKATAILFVPSTGRLTFDHLSVMIHNTTYVVSFGSQTTSQVIPYSPNEEAYITFSQLIGQRHVDRFG